MKTKDIMFKFRCDEDVASKLEIIKKHIGKSKSEIIRQGIEIQYEQIRRSQL